MTAEEEEGLEHTKAWIADLKRRDPNVRYYTLEIQHEEATCIECQATFVRESLKRYNFKEITFEKQQRCLTCILKAI